MIFGGLGLALTGILALGGGARALSNGAIYLLDRQDKFSQELRNQIAVSYKELRGLMDERFDKLDGRITALDQRVHGLDKHITVLDQRVDGLDKHITVLDQRVHGLDTEVHGLRRDIEGKGWSSRGGQQRQQRSAAEH